jgi:hypothetical protein
MKDKTEYNHNYYLKNIAKMKERVSKRYYNNKERILKHNSRHRKEIPNKMREYSQKYRDNPENRVKINMRARHYQDGFRDEIIREKGKCEICSSKNRLELHHEEYTEDKGKVKVLCQSCHKKIHRKIFNPKSPNKTDLDTYYDEDGDKLIEIPKEKSEVKNG